MRMAILLVILAISGCQQDDATTRAQNEFCWAHGYDHHYAGKCRMENYSDVSTIERLKYLEFLEENQ